MSEAALTSLERALKKIRDKQAWKMGLRVIDCTTYDGIEESFWYINAHREPNYPVPAIPLTIDIRPHVVLSWVSYPFNRGKYTQTTVLARNASHPLNN